MSYYPTLKIMMPNSFNCVSDELLCIDTAIKNEIGEMHLTGNSIEN